MLQKPRHYFLEWGTASRMFILGALSKDNFHIIILDPKIDAKDNVCGVVPATDNIESAIDKLYENMKVESYDYRLLDSEGNVHNVTQDTYGAGLFGDGRYVRGLIVDKNENVTWLRGSIWTYSIRNENMALPGEDEAKLRQRVTEQQSLINEDLDSPAATARARVALQGKPRRSKVTDEIVLQIREALALPAAKQSEIAKKFNVDPATVSDIKNNRGRFAIKTEVNNNS